MAKILFLETHRGKLEYNNELYFSTCFFNHTYPDFETTRQSMKSIAQANGHETRVLVKPTPAQAHSEIQSWKPDYITFCGHGSSYETSLEDYPINGKWLNSHSGNYMDDANGRMIHALSCMTGAELCPDSVNNYNALNYLGYTVNFYFWYSPGNQCKDIDSVCLPEPSQWFTIGLLKGKTTGESHQDAIDRADEWIYYWQHGGASNPNANGFITYLRHNYGGQRLCGNTNNRLQGQISCEDYTNQTDCINAGCYWYDGSCHTDPPPDCEDYVTKSECIANGCHWYNGSCHTNAPTCEQLNNQTDCLDYGCYWYNGSCHAFFPCENYTNQTECLNAGCHWYNGSCHTNAPTCEQLNNQSDCLDYGCYWYNNGCHTSPPPCENYTNQSDCLNAGCYWYNNSCHSYPPECSELTNQNDCVNAGCYWWNSSCHSTQPTCNQINNESDCHIYGCHWWNGYCQTNPPSTCDEIDNQSDCTKYGCYWADGQCVSEAPKKDWVLPLSIFALGMISTTGLIAGLPSKKE